MCEIEQREIEKRTGTPHPPPRGEWGAVLDAVVPAAWASHASLSLLSHCVDLLEYPVHRREECIVRPCVECSEHRDSCEERYDDLDRVHHLNRTAIESKNEMLPREKIGCDDSHEESLDCCTDRVHDCLLCTSRGSPPYKNNTPRACLILGRPIAPEGRV